MIVFTFYRFYCSIACGLYVYFFVFHSIWTAIATIIVIRAVWMGIESLVKRVYVDRAFSAHIYTFKQELGPYGIRMANKAESDRRIKKSLADVFTPDVKKFKKNMEHLEVLDTLYRAGMRPDDETYQLHDCAIKYGRFRLEQLLKKSASD
jgi:hypothetical protein